jgi:hypothetical protein
MKDELRTGAQGRIQVIFMDDTELTLGENASVVIDRYAYDKAKGIGDTTLQTIKGAFRFATGRITKLKLKTTSSTPPSPISACPAWSSGADMTCCCSKARSCVEPGQQRDAIQDRRRFQHRLPARGRRTRHLAGGEGRPRPETVTLHWL